MHLFEMASEFGESVKWPKGRRQLIISLSLQGRERKKAGKEIRFISDLTREGNSHLPPSLGFRGQGDHLHKRGELSPSS